MTEEHLLKGWDEFEPGALLYSFEEAKTRKHHENNSVFHSVADWRAEKPVFNGEHCINCQFCWIFCPDTSIISKDEKFSHVDYMHCKGCGICSDVCPTNPKSLVMFSEQVPNEEALRNWPKKDTKKDA
ncbi:MAG: pyruvate ferredoxin oxidoreductase delta subunit [Campylobacterota bacterium]|nr:pyruvate ferredoxin oxidoreductase delta subunit [Campylobacterota bacterium]